MSNDWTGAACASSLMPGRRIFLFRPLHENQLKLLRSAEGISQQLLCPYLPRRPHLSAKSNRIKRQW
jgi:hypothetical protein